jgi:threonine dehydrogenase-like Zn-dependent dehydrogenase
MRQLIVLGPGQLEWREIAEPNLLAPTDALVRPIAVSVCDAYVLFLRAKLPPREPFCFGHEFVADIVTAGEDVVCFAPGDRVVVSFLIACGTCKVDSSTVVPWDATIEGLKDPPAKLIFAR